MFVKLHMHDKCKLFDFTGTEIAETEFFTEEF